MTKSKFNIIFLVIAVLLAGYIFFIDINQKSTDQKQQTYKQVWSINPDKIISIEISAKENIEIQRDNNIWKIVKPFSSPINNSFLALMLNLNLQLEMKRLIEADSPFEKLSKYGLKAPEAIIKINTKDNVYSIEIGNKSLLGDGVFAKTTTGKSVFLLSNDYYDTVIRQYDNVRRKELFSFGDIKEFGYNGDKELKLEKDKTGIWKITKPNSYIADNALIEAYFRKLSAITFDDIMADSKLGSSRYLFENPLIDVFYNDGTGQEQGVLFIAYDEKSYLAKIKGFDAVYKVNKQKLKMLYTETNDLRSKILFPDFFNEIDKIKVYKNDEFRYSAAKEKNTWFLTKSDKNKFRANNYFYVLLEALENSEIEEFSDISWSEVLSADIYKVLLFKKEQETVLEFKIIPDKGVFVLKDDEVLRIDNRLEPSLDRGFEDFTKELRSIS
ncbi:DUF4340 domain-containing protein [bacterium]|nr:DUF4340 domain-containing protein [bacterium]